MPDLAQRLAASVSTLVDRFKLRADGPYAGLGLAETSIVARTAASPVPSVQGEIAHALGLPKTTMASAVRRLEERGLVARAASPDDRRVQLMRLTSEGEALAGHLMDAQLHASRAMLDALSEEDRVTLVHLMERIADTANNDSG